MASNETPDYRSEALQEYYFLYELVDRFDTKTLQIKNWSVTIATASMGVSIINQSPMLFILSAFISLVFWIIEAFWKSFQSAIFLRIEPLEEIIRSNDFSNYKGVFICGNYDNFFVDGKVPFKVIQEFFFYRNVMLPYFPIMIIGFVGAVVVAWK